MIFKLSLRKQRRRPTGQPMAEDSNFNPIWGYIILVIAVALVFYLRQWHSRRMDDDIETDGFQTTKIRHGNL